MKINNKKYFNLFNQSGPFELELGCGNNKRNEQAIGIDILDADGIDIVGDVYEVLAQFPDQSIDAVYGYHFLEHIPDVPKLLAELARIMNSNGHLEWVVPHFSNPYFYSDPTHRSFFGLYTFCYYAGGSYFSRKVPTYANTPGFRIYFLNRIVHFLFDMDSKRLLVVFLTRVLTCKSFMKRISVI